MPAERLTTRFPETVVRLAIVGGLFFLTGCASGLRGSFEGELAQSSPRGVSSAPRLPSAAPQGQRSPHAQKFRPVQHSYSARSGRSPSVGNTPPGNIPPSDIPPGNVPPGYIPPGNWSWPSGTGHAPGRSRYGRPIVIPQIYPNIPVGPTYGYGSPPASLNGQIEIVPLGPTRSRATFQIVPADPYPQAGSIVDTLPPPAPRAGYFELPPPAE